MVLATMAGKTLVGLSFLVAVMVATSVGLDQQHDVRTYIVHVAHTHAPPASLHATSDDLAHAYTSFLGELLPAHISQPAPSLVYSYSHAMSGFAARLTAAQAAHLQAQPSVLAVVRDKRSELYTTLTPSFLHLSPASSSRLVMESKGGEGAVIAVIDSGVYPKDRASFAADPSFPRPPRKFLGGCVSAAGFDATAYCNNKLVGAKFFSRGYETAKGPINQKAESKSPLDTDGHGTHTASTAAGAAVPNASLFGFANGTAMGMAVRAHIAVYKVCWKGGCYDTDTLAGIDEAIRDGVDVISLSLGGNKTNLFDEPVSIGTYNAIRKGIVVSASAGNDGPKKYTANNLAPWLLTVGASTIDRQFPTHIVLGNNRAFVGTSFYSGQNSAGTMKPIVFGGDVGSPECAARQLDARKVAGKIVLCDNGPQGISRAEKGANVKDAGGVGAIFFASDLTASTHLLPASTVVLDDALEIYHYTQTTANPTAKLVFFNATVIGRVSPSAPRVASFSSRGPNKFAPEILKPDVIAPGVNILAAWTGAKSPTGLDADPRRVEFNAISGTSMACPHVSGIAAMLKVARPRWSPAAIKSAIMTTAYTVDNAGGAIKNMSGQAAGPYELGAGHVDPNRALDPGLVYNATADDYLTFLCGLGYTSRQIAMFTRDNTATNCYTRSRQRPVGDLNYPAFSAIMRRSGWQVTQRRALTNVGGNVNAVYTVSSSAPPGTTLTVTPTRLVFNTTQHPTQEFSITLTTVANRAANLDYTSGSIVWSDGQHKVASPIAVIWQ